MRRTRRYSAIQGPFEKGEFSPSLPGQAGVQNGKKGEEGRKANLSTLTAAAFSLPSFLISSPSLFLVPFLLQHSFSIVSIHFRPNRNVVHCSEKTFRIWPRDGAASHPIFSCPARCHDSVCFRESNVVWQWHQLNGWPLRAPRLTHNKWASAAIADGKEEEASPMYRRGNGGRISEQKSNEVSSKLYGFNTFLRLRELHKNCLRYCS